MRIVLSTPFRLNINKLILNKMDTVNYIIEGQFEFKLTNLCGDT